MKKKILLLTEGLPPKSDFNFYFLKKLIIEFLSINYECFILLSNSKLNYNKIKILYDNGEKTAEEFLDTRISIIDAEINYINKFKIEYTNLK